MGEIPLSAIFAGDLIYSLCMVNLGWAEFVNITYYSNGCNKIQSNLCLQPLALWNRLILRPFFHAEKWPFTYQNATKIALRHQIYKAFNCHSPHLTRPTWLQLPHRLTDLTNSHDGSLTFGHGLLKEAISHFGMISASCTLKHIHIACILPSHHSHFWYLYSTPSQGKMQFNIHLVIFTRGQYITHGYVVLPPGIVVACVLPSVRPSITKFVCVITHLPLKLGSPNLDHRCKRPWLRSLLFLGVIDLDLQGQI